MPEPEIASAVRDLLRDCVNTYEKLDSLLLLRRRQIAVELVELAQELDLTRRAAQVVLEELVAGGLIIEVQPGRYAYRPADAARRDAAEALARQFEDDPVRIVQWMSRNALDRLHHTAASAFAEAVLTGKKQRDE